MLFFFSGLNAQKLDKYYTSSSGDQGTLYYVNLEDEFKQVNGPASLIYDLSVLSSKDSCYLNFSLYSPTLYRIDSLKIVYDSTAILLPVKKLFIDTDKDWHHRYSTRVPKVLLAEMYRYEQSPEFTFFTDEKELSLTQKARKWRKTSELGSRIFDLIAYNE